MSTPRGMDKDSEEPEDCGQLAELDASSEISDVLSLFGKKHTLAIMHEFAFSDSGLRFKDLEERLGISSTTLSNRLAELTDAGFIERYSYDEIPPRVEYVATEKTHSLTPIFEDLYQWIVEYEVESAAAELDGD
ncbi:winged helix-turn-helix transcriptional regulator [Haloferax larsenii]|nr:helix-turn-helix domain-containing protein [Haloferax larsenii]